VSAQLHRTGIRPGIAFISFILRDAPDFHEMPGRMIISEGNGSEEQDDWATILSDRSCAHKGKIAVTDKL
jgi:hypothetical protein